MLEVSASYYSRILVKISEAVESGWQRQLTWKELKGK